MIPEIEKDLVRWGLKKWIGMIVFILALHFGLLFWAAAPPPAPRVHPQLPRFAFGSGGSESGITDTENPLLFAAAHWHGFSGSAWMPKPQHSDPAPETLPSPRLLSYDKAADLLPDSLLPSVAPQPSFRLTPPPPAAPPPPSYSSTYSIDGELSGRGLATPLELPLQYHSDVVGSSIVQLGVDADGTVLSARLLASSGLKKADADALALARQVRFEPNPQERDSAGAELAWGKLIFHWFALDSSSTNAVPR